MSRINWLEELEWGEDQIEELRIAGYAYLRQGKYDIALKFFKALVILDPQECVRCANARWTLPAA